MYMCNVLTVLQNFYNWHQRNAETRKLFLNGVDIFGIPVDKMFHVTSVRDTTNVFL